MAIDPSPTAAPTRLTEPLRTSPAANTPAMLVSSRKRERSSAHASSEQARPVWMNPLSSRETTARPRGHGPGR